MNLIKLKYFMTKPISNLGETMKRKQTSIWEDLGALAVSGLAGYTVYKILESNEVLAQEISQSLERTDNYNYKRIRNLLQSQAGLFILNMDLNLIERIEQTINSSTDERVKVSIDRNSGTVALIEKHVNIINNRRDSGNRILKDLFLAIRTKGKQVTLTFTKEENGTAIYRDYNLSSNGIGSGVDIKYSFNKYMKAFYINTVTGRIFSQTIPVSIGIFHEFKHATLAVRGESFFIRNKLEALVRGFNTDYPENGKMNKITAEPEETLIIGKPMPLYLLKTEKNGNATLAIVNPPDNFGPTENDLYAEQGFKYRRISHDPVW